MAPYAAPNTQDSANTLFGPEEWDSLVGSLQLEYQPQHLAYSNGEVCIELTQVSTWLCTRETGLLLFDLVMSAQLQD